ncbi:MAG TPA: beta-ketoacyl-[acyl-carrier-protein] synthase family protein [Micromonosporaceae bacterium]
MPDTRRRVAVTGIGVVSSLGIGIADFARAVRAGRTGFTPISSFDTSRFSRIMGGEVTDFDAKSIVETITPDDWGRSSQFAAAAARLAVRDAGIDPGELAEATTSAVMGTTSGESAVLQRLAEQWSSGGPDGVEWTLAATAPAGRISDAVASELRLTGESCTIASACAASNYALGVGYDLVSCADADFVLAGGADAMNRHNHAGFLGLGALAPDVVRPFDADRAGIITAEGGVALLLEPLDHAQARGAHCYAEVLGYGANCDAAHMVHPDADSIAECIRLAHSAAGVSPADIDYICAHGTGTAANDVAEVGAIRAVFGATLPPISSIKSMIGHTMGAASGFGAAISCMALYEGFLPPTANLTTVDPELGPGLDCVPGVARPADVRVVQNHGFAFGGNNAITILGRL